MIQQQALLVLQLVLFQNVQRTPGIEFVSPLHQVEPFYLCHACEHSKRKTHLQTISNWPVWSHCPALHWRQRLYQFGLEVRLLSLQVTDKTLLTKKYLCGGYGSHGIGGHGGTTLVNTDTFLDVVVESVRTFLRKCSFFVTHVQKKFFFGRSEVFSWHKKHTWCASAF